MTRLHPGRLPIEDPWDKYFYGIAASIMSNSKCFSRKVGAILVWERSIVATGYNGPPRGVPHCDERCHSGGDRFLLKAFSRKADEEGSSFAHWKGACPRRALGYSSGEGLEYCVAAHAEVNCIANAAMLGHETKDTIMYLTWRVPCKDCLVVLINAGVTGCVCTSLEHYDKETQFLLDHGFFVARKYK